MGSTAAGTDEQPVHTVSFTHDFWMDTTEVTQTDFQTLMGVNPSNFIGNTISLLKWFPGVTPCFTAMPVVKGIV